MVLKSFVTLLTGKPARTASLIRKMMRVTCLIVFAAPAQYALADAGGVYVVGQGKGLDQAFSQALAENPRKAASPFWIVVSGQEIARTTKNGASPAVAGWVHTARERGGLVYVCRSDMMRAGIKEGDLLDGVMSMYGYDAKDWAGLLPARKEGITLPDNMKQSQMILKTCTSETKP